jgi:predicted nucleotide-binding protein (sugar kinase/HSP70/actin superfamily)
MRKRIGIPRALLYYKYYPFWRSFLEGLGFQVIVSPPTNKEILSKGIKVCTDEACFPLKVFCGHIAWLKERVEQIFIYRIRSIERRGFLCSKFWGLPDIVRNLFPKCSLLTLNIDCNKHSYFKPLFWLGLKFKRNPYQVLRIIKEAARNQKEFLKLMQDKKHNVLEAIEVMEKGKFFKREPFSYKLKIALLSHPYNIYDRFISLDILKKLEDMKARVFTYEMIPEKELLKERKTFENIYWTYDREIAQAASLFIKEGIDGIVFVVSFPCGPDSLVIDYLIRKFKNRVPILNLVIDEHQADTGIQTRLESFLDIVKRRRLNEVQCPPYG